MVIITQYKNCPGCKKVVNRPLPSMKFAVVTAARDYYMCNTCGIRLTPQDICVLALAEERI